MKSHFVKTLIIVILMSFGLMGLSACGVKPSRVNPPESAQNDNFPRQYPTQ